MMDGYTPNPAFLNRLAGYVSDLVAKNGLQVIHKGIDYATFELSDILSLIKSYENIEIIEEETRYILQRVAL